MTLSMRPSRVTGRRHRPLLGLGVVVAALLVGNAEARATEYFVAGDDPLASDSNHGLSPERPFKTLTRGVRGLTAGDALVVRAGVYRESLVIPQSGTRDNPITIRASSGDEGRVVIRGSERVTGWGHDQGNVWSIPWAPLPPLTYPAGWPDYGEYSRRREMVFVDGEPLRQVVTRSQLADGRFVMDDDAQVMRIQIQGDPNRRRVEIAVRDQGVVATGSYHVFRGLTVEHVTGTIWMAAMHLGTHQHVEDCVVIHNNGDGIKAYSETVISHTRSNFNGRLGIALNGSGSLLISTETSHNSWRYGPRWEAGGIKVLGGQPTDNRILHHTAVSNNGIGIWFDTCGPGNLVDGAVLTDNVFSGLEFEATAGPNRAVNNVISSTRKTQPDSKEAIDGAGIVVYDSSHVELFNNTIVDVSGPGIAIAGNQRDGGLISVDTRVINNIITGSGRAAISFEWLSGPARDETKLSSHVFDHNLYHLNPTTVIFPALRESYGLDSWDLNHWQLKRRQDLNSVNAPPGFLDTSDGSYSLSDSSPAIDAGQNLDSVTTDFDGRRRPQGPGTDIGAFEHLPIPAEPPSRVPTIPSQTLEPAVFRQPRVPANTHPADSDLTSRSQP